MNDILMMKSFMKKRINTTSYSYRHLFQADVSLTNRKRTITFTMVYYGFKCTEGLLERFSQLVAILDCLDTNTELQTSCNTELSIFYCGNRNENWSEF